MNFGLDKLFKQLKWIVIVLLLVIVSLLLNGCAYLDNQLRDHYYSPRSQASLFAGGKRVECYDTIDDDKIKSQKEFDRTYERCDVIYWDTFCHWWQTYDFKDYEIHECMRRHYWAKDKKGK